MITVALPFYQGDKEQAVRLAEWIKELGHVSDFDCLLVVGQDTNPDGVIELLRTVFKSVSVFQPRITAKRNADPIYGHAPVSNAMFTATAWHFFYTVQTPFLWLEPDVIPLQPTWLKDIQREYDQAVKKGKAFMGSRIKPKGVEFMPGVAVYPKDVCEYSSVVLLSGNTPWDLNAAKEILPHAEWTPLIQHDYNPSWNFKDAESLKEISPDAVIFHRDKSGELIKRLREKANQIPRDVPVTPLLETPTVPSTVIKPARVKRSKSELKKMRQAQAAKARAALAEKIAKRKEGDVECRDTGKEMSKMSASTSNGEPNVQPAGSPVIAAESRTFSSGDEGLHERIKFLGSKLMEEIAKL